MCKFKLSYISIALISILNQTQTQAQEPNSASEVDMVETIIVTTDRRMKSIQDVSATVQAFDAEDLSQLAVNNEFKNLQNIVSGLHIARQEGKFEVFIRGIGSSDSDFSSDPSVATHYNGVYLPRPRSIGPMFFDIERVEVNKGPQGTVRGRNATGGSINFISNRPEFDEFYGSLNVGLGNFDRRSIESVMNFPVSDTLAFRTAIFSQSHDSLLSNAYGAGVKAPGAYDTTAVRVSALWEPSDTFSAYLLTDYVKEEGSGQPGAFSGRALSAGFDIDELDDPWNQYFKSEGEQHNDIGGIATTLSWAVGGINIEYNGAYRTYDFKNKNASREWQLGQVYPSTSSQPGSQAEATYQAFFNEGGSPSRQAFPDRINLINTFYQYEESSTQTHELRIFNDDDKKFTYSTGVFFMDETYDNVSWDLNAGAGFSVRCWFESTLAQGAPSLCNFQDGLGGENRNDDSNVESLAVYFDGTYELNDNTRIFAGIRWTEDTKKANESNVKYMLITPDSTLEAFGLTINENTNPISNGLVLGTNGIELAPPGSRGMPFPTTICNGWNDCGSDYSPDPYNLDYFLGGIAQFGVGDNLDDYLNEFGDQVEVQILSDFYTDINPNVFSNDKVTNDYVDWRVGIEYDVSKSHLLYASVSTGTRAGGINRPIVLASGERLARTWEPEELTVFELGSKNDFVWSGLPIRINTSLFYYDYQDKVIQNLISVPNPRPTDPDAQTSFVFNANSADASVYGLDIQGHVGLTDNLNFRWNALFMDSEFENSSVVDTRGGNNVISIDGNKLPNTSDASINASINHYIETNGEYIKGIDWTLSLSFRTDYFLSIYNNKGYAVDDNGDTIEIPLEEMSPANNPALADTGGQANGNFFSDEVGSYAQFNANAGFNFGSDDRYRVDFWVNNITDEAYSGKAFINNSVNIRFLNSPRTWGINFKSSF